MPKFEIDFHQCPAPQAKDRPLVLFVHHYGGSRKSMKRHVGLVNELGFDAATFDLTQKFYGTQKRWSLQIDEALNYFPDRKKILFAFSGPSSSSLRSVARRFLKGMNDVVGIVCDSGPFMDAWYCTRIMLRDVEGLTNALLREAILAVMMLRWDSRHPKPTLRALKTIKSLNPNFPILSIQGAKDQIVPPWQIQPVFAQAELQQYQEHVLPEAGHLNGLKVSKEAYTQIVKNFFQRWA
ncbi:MAG: alpha/beta hydrolase [Oligoflexia bacterium]|nr:alpha/beta hydrolase [Oligoflexia bacterium]